MPPSNRLAEKVTRILYCCAPECLHQVPEMVQRAQSSNISDEEFLNMLCHRYAVSRDGWPLDLEKRRRARLERFFRTNAPEEMHKMNILLKQRDVTEEEMMDDLKKRYGRDEFGDSTDPDTWLSEHLQLVFSCMAPERLASVDTLLTRRQLSGVTHGELLDAVCDELGVGRDGWPCDPKKRLRAKLTRFFINNAPSELRKVESICKMSGTEHEIMTELFALYHKDEFGKPVATDKKIREKLSLFLSVASPNNLQNVDSLIAYQKRRNLTDDQLMELLQQQLKVGSDGWPKNPKERLRMRLTRFFLNNKPQDIHKVDTLMALDGCSEDDIMKQLYDKYGVDELGGRIIGQDDDITDKLFEFYEKYVPESDVRQLVDQALALQLPEAKLMPLLQERYKGIPPKRNKLREQVALIYRRAAPGSIREMRSLFALKRRDNMTDSDCIAALCTKLDVGPDGWPKDAAKRRQLRLQLFFRNNAPGVAGARLDELMTDPRTEEQLFQDLYDEYGKDELGSDLESDAETDRDTVDDILDEENKKQEESEGDALNQGPLRPFVPGATQVWPPPTVDTVETLYNTQLFQSLLRKYGTSEWSSVGMVDVDDNFARIRQRFEMGEESDEDSLPPQQQPNTNTEKQAKIIFDRPPVAAKTPDPLKQVQKVQREFVTPVVVASPANPIQLQNAMTNDIVRWLRHREQCQQPSRGERVQLAKEHFLLSQTSKRDVSSDASVLSPQVARDASTVVQRRLNEMQSDSARLSRHAPVGWIEEDLKYTEMFPASPREDDEAAVNMSLACGKRPPKNPTPIPTPAEKHRGQLRFVDGT